MNKTLNVSMRRVIRSGTALLAVVMAPLSLVSAACMDDPVDKAAPEVADVELAASVDDADVADKKANADLLADCSVHGDGRLYCGNEYNAPLYAERPFYSHGVYDHMFTTYSWFNCWAYGDLHPGGNYTWYHSTGDEYGRDGFMPANYVHTPSWFDANPKQFGLRNCFESFPD